MKTSAKSLILASGCVLAVALNARNANAQAQLAGAPVATPVATPTPRAPEAVTVTDEEVEGTLVRMGRSETVIDAPMELVVRAMMDFTRYNEFMPHVRESRVVRRNRAATDVYMQVPLGGSLGVIWALLRLDAQRGRDRFALDGRAVDSNMDRFETHTVIERVAGDAQRTRVVFRVLALPRLPFPSSVFTREMRDAARTVAQNLRARIARQQALATMALVPSESAPSNATSQR